MILLLIATLIVLILYIYLAPVGECPKCAHCRFERAEKQRIQNELQDDLAHRLDMIDKDICECDKCTSIRKRRG